MKQAIIAAALAALATAATAAFPDKPVKIINGFAAGGGSDILLRAITPVMQRLPSAICAAMSRATSICRWCCARAAKWRRSPWGPTAPARRWA